jgi:hypothetical protein
MFSNFYSIMFRRFVNVVGSTNDGNLKLNISLCSRKFLRVLWNIKFVNVFTSAPKKYVINVLNLLSLKRFLKLETLGY